MPGPDSVSSMDDYAAARESGAPAEVAVSAVPSAPSAESSASPSGQDSASSGTAQQPETPSPNESGAEPQQPNAEDAQRRRSRGVQKRLDELTRRAADAERREQLLLEAHSRLVSQGQQAPAPQQQRPEDAAPKEEDYPGDYRAFLRAEAKYEARQEAQRLDAERRAEAAREREESTRNADVQRQVEQVGAVVADFESRNDAFARATPDYDAVVANLDHIEIGPHNAAMVQTLLMRPDSPQILHAFGRNPAAAEAISRMPPALQGAALGEFAAHIARAPRPSNAPAPGRPVGVRAPGVGGLVVSGSMDDYAASRGHK